MSDVWWAIGRVFVSHGCGFFKDVYDNFNLYIQDLLNNCCFRKENGKFNKV